MNKLFFLILLVSSLLFTSCTETPVINKTETPTIIMNTNTPSTTQAINLFEYKALYAYISNRNPKFNENTYVFNDITSFTEYIINNGNTSYFNSELYFTESANENVEYTINAIEKYNQDFFNDNTLILYMFIAGSLNMYHEVNNVLQENEKLYIDITGYVPWGGLPAEKTCYVLLEIPKNNELISNDINITFNDCVFLDEN